MPKEKVVEAAAAADVKVEENFASQAASVMNQGFGGLIDAKTCEAAAQAIFAQPDLWKPSATDDESAVFNIAQTAIESLFWAYYGTKDFSKAYSCASTLMALAQNKADPYYLALFAKYRICQLYCESKLYPDCSFFNGSTSAISFDINLSDQTPFALQLFDRKDAARNELLRIPFLLKITQIRLQIFDFGKMREEFEKLKEFGLTPRELNFIANEQEHLAFYERILQLDDYSASPEKSFFDKVVKEFAKVYPNIVFRKIATKAGPQTKATQHDIENLLGEAYRIAVENMDGKYSNVSFLTVAYHVLENNIETKPSHEREGERRNLETILPRLIGKSLSDAQRSEIELQRFHAKKNPQNLENAANLGSRVAQFLLGNALGENSRFPAVDGIAKNQKRAEFFSRFAQINRKELPAELARIAAIDPTVTRDGSPDIEFLNSMPKSHHANAKLLLITEFSLTENEVKEGKKIAELLTKYSVFSFNDTPIIFRRTLCLMLQIVNNVGDAESQKLMYETIERGSKHFDSVRNVDAQFLKIPPAYLPALNSFVAKDHAKLSDGFLQLLAPNVVVAKSLVEKRNEAAASAGAAQEGGAAKSVALAAAGADKTGAIATAASATTRKKLPTKSSAKQLELEIHKTKFQDKVDAATEELNQYCAKEFVRQQYPVAIMQAAIENPTYDTPNLALSALEIILFSNIHGYVDTKDLVGRNNFGRALIVARATNVLMANNPVFSHPTFNTKKHHFKILQLYLENIINPNFLNSHLDLPNTYAGSNFLTNQEFMNSFGTKTHIPLQIVIAQIKSANPSLTEIEKSLQELGKIKTSYRNFVNNELETLHIYREILALGDYSASPHAQLFDYIKQQLSKIYVKATIDEDAANPAREATALKCEALYKKVIALAKDNLNGRYEECRLLVVANAVMQFGKKDVSVGEEDVSALLKRHAAQLALTNFDPVEAGNIAFAIYQKGEPVFDDRKIQRDPHYFLRLAANSGNAQAQFLLAQFLDPACADVASPEVEKDPELAMLYYAFASENGYSDRAFVSQNKLVKDADPSNLTRDVNKFKEDYAKLQDFSLYSREIYCKNLLFQEWSESRERTNESEWNFRMIGLYNLLDSPEIAFRKVLLRMNLFHCAQRKIERTVDPETKAKCEETAKGITSSIELALFDIAGKELTIDQHYRLIPPHFVTNVDNFILQAERDRNTRIFRDNFLRVLAKQSLSAAILLIERNLKENNTAITLTECVANFGQELAQNYRAVNKNLTERLNGIVKSRKLSKEQKSSIQNFIDGLQRIALEQEAKKAAAAARVESELRESQASVEEAQKKLEGAKKLRQEAEENRKLDQEELLKLMESMQHLGVYDDTATPPDLTVTPEHKKDQAQQKEEELENQEDRLLRKEEAEITAKAIAAKQKQEADFLKMLQSNLQKTMDEAIKIFEKKDAKQARRKARLDEAAKQENSAQDHERAINAAIAREAEDEMAVYFTSKARLAKIEYEQQQAQAQEAARKTAQLEQHKAAQQLVVQLSTQAQVHLNETQITQINALIKFCDEQRGAFFLEALRDDDIKYLLSDYDPNILEAQTDEKFIEVFNNILSLNRLTSEDHQQIYEQILKCNHKDKFFAATQKTVYEIVEEAKYLLLRAQNKFPRANCEIAELLKFAGTMNQEMLARSTDEQHDMMQKVTLEKLHEAKAQNGQPQGLPKDATKNLMQILEILLLSKFEKTPQPKNKTQYFEAIAQDETNNQDLRAVAYFILANQAQQDASNPQNTNQQLVACRRQQFFYLREAIKFGSDFARQKASDCCVEMLDLHEGLFTPAKYSDLIEDFVELKIVEAEILMVNLYLNRDVPTPTDTSSTKEQWADYILDVVNRIRQNPTKNETIETFKSHFRFKVINQYERPEQLIKFQEALARTEETLDKTKLMLTYLEYGRVLFPDLMEHLGAELRQEVEEASRALDEEEAAQTAAQEMPAQQAPAIIFAPLPQMPLQMQLQMQQQMQQQQMQQMTQQPQYVMRPSPQATQMTYQQVNQGQQFNGGQPFYRK